MSNLNEPKIIDFNNSQWRMSTYAEAHKLVNRVANGVLAFGFPPGSRIALIGENSIQYFSIFLAIRKAGLVAVPINRSASDSQLQYILKDCDARLLFMDPSRRSDMRSSYRTISLGNECDNFFSTFSSTPPPRLPEDESPAFMIYTSGSTGTPKGVVITRQARRALKIAQALSRRSNEMESQLVDRTLVATPFSHILALNLVEPLFEFEQSFVLLPKFEPLNFVRAIETYKVTILSFVPAMLAMLAREPGLLESADLSSVRHIYFSSAPLSQSIADLAVRFFPNATLENCYGITEVGSNLFGPHPEGLARPLLSVGYPRKGIQYRLCKGELEIKAPSMFKGYQGNSTLSTQAFTGDGYYRTRDRFNVDTNGYYFFAGRSDDMFICGGENTYPLEISRILESHPAVRSAAVVPLPDDVKGEKPYAFVVLVEDGKITEDELKGFVLNHGSPHLVPRHIWFLKELPLNQSFKPDKQKLLNLASEYFKSISPNEERGN